MALLALASALSASAQTNCNSWPLELEVGVEDSLGVTQWSCGDVAAWSAEFRVRAPEGTWVMLLARVEVFTDDPAHLLELIQLYQRFPWLAPSKRPATDLGAATPYPITLLPSPDLQIDPALTDQFIAAAMTGLDGQLNPINASDGVRVWAQPVLDNDEDGPETLEVAQWHALANETQVLWAPVLATAWLNVLTNPTLSAPDKATFSMYSLMQQAVLLQAPTKKAAVEFLQSSFLGQAIDLGLTLQVQAIGMIDPAPGDIGNDPNTTPGLPSLDFSQPVGPLVSVSAPTPVHILPGIPLGGGDIPGTPPPPVVGFPGRKVTVVIHNVVQPASVRYLTASGAFSRAYPLEFVGPGHFEIQIHPDVDTSQATALYLTNRDFPDPIQNGPSGLFFFPAGIIGGPQSLP